MNKRKGFTLIEVVVVMGILAVLMALAAPGVLKYLKDAEVTVMRGDISTLETALAVLKSKGKDIEYKSSSRLEGNITNIVHEGEEYSKLTAENLLTMKVEIESKDITKFAVVRLKDASSATTGQVVYLDGIPDSSGIMQYGIENRVGN